MNENDQANVPPPIAPVPGIIPPPLPPGPKPLSWWLRKLLACNPFYLVSAALLLYGCYRVSIDSPFLNRESARLVFNFTSIQAYEILLVLVAIFLARRRLWYDSTLLVGLENLLVLVPFILISQAALTGSMVTRVVGGTAVALAVLRFGALKKYFTPLNLPGRLLAAGFVLLAVNLALPLIYQHFELTKYGTYLEYGPAYQMNERTWLLVLPAVLALANFLPKGKGKAEGDLLPQHRWLPAGLFSLWVAVTCVHLYALDYVFEYYLRPELFAPAAWVLAWTLYLRCPGSLKRLKYALTVPALLAPLLAALPGGEKIFLIISALNLAGYGLVSLLHRENRLAPHLIYASGLMLVAGLPEVWLHHIAPSFASAQCVTAGIVVYSVLWIAWQCNPKLAVLGSILFGFGILAMFHGHAGAGHWALQSAFVFLLLHSLRWNDAEHSDANKVRILTGLVWVIESFVWVNCDSGRIWMPLISGAIVFGIYCACLPCRGIWRLFVVPAAALLVVLSGPCSAAADAMRSAPTGLLAILASFLFLGFGTMAALTRRLWHKHEHD